MFRLVTSLPSTYAWLRDGNCSARKAQPRTEPFVVPLGFFNASEGGKMTTTPSFDDNQFVFEGKHELAQTILAHSESITDSLKLNGKQKMRRLMQHSLKIWSDFGEFESVLLRQFIFSDMEIVDEMLFVKLRSLSIINRAV
jgi:hypothetical protein